MRAAFLLVLAALPGGAAPSTGYLPAGSTFDVIEVLPPAPRNGDARDRADRAIFQATRSLLGTPRGALATSDVKTGDADMLADYACATGLALAPTQVPMTLKLIHRATIDTARQTARAKDYFKRLRPLLSEEGPTCQTREHLETSFDYPSGHTTRGWVWAMLLTDLLPDRASLILARGRAYGESRVICGAHNASAVEAGRLSATATLTAISAESAFRADLDAARREIDALRQSAPRPEEAACTTERALVAQPLPAG